MRSSCASAEVNADVLLVSQTVTQKDVHIQNLTELIELAEAEGVRDKYIFCCGGARITHAWLRSWAMMPLRSGHLRRRRGHLLLQGAGPPPGQVRRILLSFLFFPSAQPRTYSSGGCLLFSLFVAHL